jgi:hypothetical protein
VEQITISGGDGQTPRHHHSTTNLQNALHLPTPTRKTVMEMREKVKLY